jgi:hypothetical protein
MAGLVSVVTLAACSCSSFTGLSYQLNDDFPCTRTIVKVQQDDLLPRTEQRAAFFNGNRQRRAEKRSAEVRKTVVVTPTIIVVVSSVRRNELLDEFLEIADQTGLMLHGGQCGSGARNEERHEPALDFFLFDLFPDFGGDVDDVAETGSLL